MNKFILGKLKKSWRSYLVGAIGLISGIIGIIDYVDGRIESGYRKLEEEKKKMSLFDYVYAESLRNFGEKYVLHSNRIISMIPWQLQSEPDVSLIGKLHYYWNYDMKILSDFYSGLNKCLKTGECIPGKEAQHMCRTARSQIRSNNYILDRFKKIGGLSFDTSGTNIPKDENQTSTISIPDSSVIEAVIIKACSEHQL